MNLLKLALQKSGLYTAITNGKKTEFEICIIAKRVTHPHAPSVQLNFSLLRPPSFPRKTRQAKTKMTLALLTHQKSLQTRMPLYKRSPPASRLLQTEFDTHLIMNLKALF